MRCNKDTLLLSSNLFLLLFLSLPNSECASVKDIFNLNTDVSARVPRDNKYYSGRYGSSSSNASPLNRAIKPEDSLEAREATQTPVEKRCTRCESSYSDYRNPYESRSRYDDRRYRDRYDSDDKRYLDRYDDRRYDRYDDRDRYDRYDRRPTYDRYDRDRYDTGSRDRYDRDRYDTGRDRYDQYDRYSDRDYDRGFGYDNRGYDYRDRGSDDYNRDGYGGSGGRGGLGGNRYYGSSRPDSGAGYWGTGNGYASSWNYGGGRDDYRDREPYLGFRPWDETYRGISGWDSLGRGYYFATGIPEVGSDYWGSGLAYTGTSDYSGKLNNYENRYGGGGGGGGSYGGGSRRDPYDGYRATSYLYARPSSTTTNRPSLSADSDSGVTQSPQQQDNTSG